MCDDKSFVRSAALRVYKGPSGAGKTEIPVSTRYQRNANTPSATFAAFAGPTSSVRRRLESGRGAG